MEVGGDGGVETGFGAEVVGNEAGEVIVAAVAEGAGAAGDLVVAVTVGGVEGMGGVDGFGSGDGAAFRAAAEGGGWGDGGGGMPRRWQMKKVNSALGRRAPGGINWAVRREEAPRRAQAGFLVNSETRHTEGANNQI